MNDHYERAVNNYLNSNHTKYLTQLCDRFAVCNILQKFIHFLVFRLTSSDM